MGLVQVPNEKVKPDAPTMDVEGVRITWERDVEEMNGFYGTLIIDYLKSFLGSDFILGYEGSTC